jgi:DNA-binding CsgD family transcriptional regulator
VFDPDTRALILDLTREGHGVAEIARRLRVAESTVHHHLRQGVRTINAVPPAPVADGARRDARSHVTTRVRVAALLADGLSRAEIARRLEVSKSTVSYHARRLGEEIDTRCARRYDWRAVQAFHDEGHGVRACIREFGFSSETWHSAVKRGAITARSPFLPIEVVFAAGTPRNRGHLKKRLLALGLRTDQCERCSIREWQGEPLSMALHHVNGDRDDNRLENLQLLCPNCHSETENFAGRRRATTAARRVEDAA